MSPLWMFPALLIAILTGFPVALTMMSLAVIFGLHVTAPGRTGTVDSAIATGRRAARQALRALRT